MPVVIRDLIREARRRLVSAPHQPPPREAALLLGHLLGWSEAQVLARDDRTLSDDARSRFEGLLERRLQGAPVAYLTGEREFFGRSFAVDPRVLIPRPETEHLVAAALSRPLPAGARILDLGTGSGCIAITLALELADARVVAVDRRLGPLALARHNAHRLAPDSESQRISIVGSTWSGALDLTCFDLVVSNPPYITPAEMEELSPEITAFEPASALVGGSDGLADYRTLLSELRALAGGTPVMLEVGADQAAAVVDIASRRGFHHEGTLPDYAGRDRVVVVNRA